ncbi:flavin reductase family protein [Brevibacillus sp. NRS-1366]|uniref:flavin reductase family protein n=1 Tax=Brevibacillus sp. NRS-1366 TaxID=3233899 RepID=UPI003D1A14F3
MDDRLFRNAMGKFATGVTVITTELDGQPYGMTANAFMSVSLQPKLVLVSVSVNAHMHDRIKRAKKYAVNILSQHQQELSALFAGQKTEETVVSFDRLDDIPVLKDTIATITCLVVDEHLAGDHILFIGEVTDLRLAEGEPLLYSQGKYRELAALPEHVSN